MKAKNVSLTEELSKKMKPIELSSVYGGGGLIASTSIDHGTEKTINPVTCKADSRSVYVPD